MIRKVNSIAGYLSFDNSLKSGFKIELLTNYKVASSNHIEYMSNAIVARFTSF